MLGSGAPVRRGRAPRPHAGAVAAGRRRRLGAGRRGARDLPVRSVNVARRPVGALEAPHLVDLDARRRRPPSGISAGKVDDLEALLPLELREPLERRNAYDATPVPEQTVRRGRAARRGPPRARAPGLEARPRLCAARRDRARRDPPRAVPGRRRARARLIPPRGGLATTGVVERRSTAMAIIMEPVAPWLRELNDSSRVTPARLRSRSRPT